MNAKPLIHIRSRLVTVAAVPLAIAVVTLSTIVLAGCGSSNQSSSESLKLSSSVPFDRAFIDAMVPHHRAAIKMAESAQKSGLSSPTLNAVALNVIDSQQQEIKRMLAWRKKWYGSKTIDPNAGEQLGMSMTEMGMGGNMLDLRGSNIDGSFASMMVAHHLGAIRMAQLAASRAQHPEIKRLARQIISTQQHEVQLMKPLSGTTGDHTMTGMNMG
jgi:uncharacterized protein (DUF305 family)